MSDKETLSSKEIVDRLRNVANLGRSATPLLSRAAANEIERLQQRLAEQELWTEKWHRLAEAIATILEVNPNGSLTEVGNGISQAIYCLKSGASQPPKETPLTIDGHQVAALVDFLDINGTPEARETELCLRYYAEDRMEPGEHGELMPAGLYAWFEEYPEEGQLLLVPHGAAVTKTVTRCHCGTHEWPPNTARIEDSRGRMHFADRCTVETNASPSVMERDVIVCSVCERACCWQGEFMCDSAEMAGTKMFRVRDLHAKPRGENAEYWFKDGDGVINTHALAAYRRAVSEEASP